MVAADLGRVAPQFVTATAVALAVWAVVLAAIDIATRPRHVDPGPEVLELPGDEPPAVVNFITHGWQVDHAAVPATLLDLAARGAATFERNDVDDYSLHLTGATPPNLTTYEQMVFDHVRGLASNGSVPCAALATGPEAQSARWWKNFSAAVRTDAASRGLSRPKFSASVLSLFGLLSVAPAVLSLFAIIAVAQRQPHTGLGVPAAVIGEPFFVWGALMGMVRRTQGNRDTDLGRSTASKWAGLREKLHGDDVFADLPPPAISLWDRFLGYGAALGVAAGAVRALPLGSESDTEAWSSVGGRWRIVRVSYPKRFWFGWGDHPLAVAWRGLWNMAFPVFAVVVAWPAIQDNRADIVKAGTDQPKPWIDHALSTGAVVVGIVLAVVAVRALYMLVVGVGDLFSRVPRTGKAIRVRTRGSGKKQHRYVAIDGGSRHQITAWRVALSSTTREGDTVDAVATRWLGYVRSMVSKETLDTAAASPLESSSIRPAHLLSADQVSAAVGEQVTDSSDAIHAASATNTMLAGIQGEVSAFKASDGMVIVGRAPSQGRQLYSSSVGRLPSILRKPVDGVGEEAAIILGRTLIARKGDEVVAVSISLHHLDTEASAAAATTLARSLLS